MRTWVVLLVMTISLLVLAFSMPIQGSPPFDPFLPYADLLSKDQMFAAVRSSEFSCTERYEEARTLCSIKPDDDVFFEIFIIIKGDRPEGITFQVKEDALRVGDLAALWGAPDVLFPHSAPRLLWQDQDGTTISALVPSADRLNHFAPVWMVSFTL